MKNYSLIGLGATIAVATALTTGCAPGDTTGKISGETKYRMAFSRVSGFNHTDCQTNLACIEVKLGAQILEAFAGIDPNTFINLNPALVNTFNPNAMGAITLNDKTLKFTYAGDVVYGNLYNSTATAPTLPAEVQNRLAPNGHLNPEFQARMENSFKPFKKIEEIHRQRGAKFNGVFFAAGHGRNDLKRDDDKSPTPPPAGGTCGSYFFSVTLQTTVDLDAGSLDSFFSIGQIVSGFGIPIGSTLSGPLPAGTTIQLFVAAGDCGDYEAIGVSDKGKIRVQIDPPPAPLAPK